MKSYLKAILIISLILNVAAIYTIFRAAGYRRSANLYLDKYTHVVSEFSGRSRYEADNRMLVSEEQARNRLVFMGSQITENWDLDHYFEEFEAINRGISGQRLAGYLLRFMPDVIELEPKAAVIEFSSYNFRPQNSLDELKDYIVSIATLARYNGIQPVLTTVIPVRQELDMFDSYSVSDSLNRFNDWLKEYCLENEYLLADFNHVLSNERGFLAEEYSIDNTHLTDVGYDRISRAMLRTLERLE
jgi:alpha-L-fucosidase